MSLVSIITPTYNSEKYISQTIESIINQTHTNWELIITDDCSTDSTIKIIESFAKKDNRIRINKLESNSGAGIARNNSIAQAKGRFIAFCDSDDIWLPEKLERQLIFLTKNNLSFTYSGFDIIDERGKVISKHKPPRRLTFKDLLLSNEIGCLTAIYDTSLLGKMYMSEMRNRQDWVLWLNILKQINTAEGLTNSLALYRIRKGSISRSKIDMLKFHWKVYSKEMNFNTIESVRLLSKYIFHYIKKFIL